MSTIKVNNLSGKGGATPNLPDGAVISGVATVTNLKPTNVNVSGAVTATTFDGSLKSTGTPTLGLGVTINSSGINVSGVLTATTFHGSGSALTGVGESIAPWYYNPDVNDQLTTIDTGIGITFNKLVNMGSGTATLKMVNAGVAGTTIQSWGISSVTKSAVTEFTFNSLVSNLVINKTYQLDIPEGYVVSSTGTNYAGTAYTFATQDAESKLFSWGDNENGRLGLNGGTDRSSPTQIPGLTWSANSLNQDWDYSARMQAMIKTDGTLWTWGAGSDGGLGQGSNTDKSSPTQIGTETTWSSAFCGEGGSAAAIKTDGTLWTWGNNNYGQLGLGDQNQYSSPKQVPGTTWATGDYKLSGGLRCIFAIKTDGTMWALGGEDDRGELGQNSNSNYSSPRMIYGDATTWSKTFAGHYSTFGIKTDGTLWSWGDNGYGQLGLNEGSPARKSSPVQIPGTTWSHGSSGWGSVFGIKTDGTLWAWGENEIDCLGLNTGHDTNKSSPVQVPGTTWSKIAAARDHTVAIKTDGTIWSWGEGADGQLGQNNTTKRSSPTQIGSDTIWQAVMVSTDRVFALINDQTP